MVRYHRGTARALIVLACLAGVAAADRVRSLTLRPGAEFARVEVGTRAGKAYVATCGAKTCVELGVFGDEAEVLGVVDLEGAPRALPDGMASDDAL